MRYFKPQAQKSSSRKKVSKLLPILLLVFLPMIVLCQENNLKPNSANYTQTPLPVGQAEEKDLVQTPNTLLASTETGLASTVKINATPSPTPPSSVDTDDLLTDLCVKAAREVEALRLTSKAKDTYIE